MAQEPSIIRILREYLFVKACEERYRDTIKPMCDCKKLPWFAGNHCATGHATSFDDIVNDDIKKMFGVDLSDRTEV